MDYVDASGAIIDAALAFFLDICLKTTCLLAVTALVAFAVRRRTSAAMRHLLWLVGLIGALLIPLLSLPLRGHEMYVSPTVAAASAVLHGRLTEGAPVHQSIQPTAAGTHTTSSLPLSVTTTDSGPNIFFVWANFLPPQPFVLPFFYYGFVVAGTGLLGQRKALRRLRLRWIRLTIGSDIDRLATDALRSLEIRREVEIRMASANHAAQIPTPMMWGIRRPVIALPPDAENWPEERLRAALLHEAAHIKRNDYLTIVILARVVTGLYWYNPLVWYAARQLRIESEQACDDLVLTAGRMASTDYARCLLDVARDARRGTHATVSMAQTSRIERRLRAILDSALNRTLTNQKMRIGAALTLTVVVCWVSLFCLAASPDDPKLPITLSNGATVRLFGVAEGSAGQGSQWWRADGGPLAEPIPIASPPSPSPEPQLPGNLHFRTIAVAVTYRPEDQPHETWAAGFRPDSDNNAMLSGQDVWPVGTSGREFVVKPQMNGFASPLHYDEEHTKISAQIKPVVHDRQTELEMIPQLFDLNEHVAQIEENIVCGPWTDVLVFPNKMGVSTVRSRAGGAQMVIASASRKDWPDIVSIKTYDWFPGTFAAQERRIVAVDRDGHVIACVAGRLSDHHQEFPGSLMKTGVEGYLPRRLLPRVAEFQLMVRPARHVAFRHISLEPRATR